MIFEPSRPQNFDFQSQKWVFFWESPTIIFLSESLDVLYFCQRRTEPIDKYDDQVVRNLKNGTYGLKRVVYCNREINHNGEDKGTDDRSMIQELSDTKILVSKDKYKEFRQSLY